MSRHLVVAVKQDIQCALKVTSQAEITPYRVSLAFIITLVLIQLTIPHITIVLFGFKMCGILKGSSCIERLSQDYPGMVS